MNAGGTNIVLLNDIVIDGTLTANANFTKNKVKTVLNLNGKSLKNEENNSLTDVIVVSAVANLTINGEGTVEAVSGNDGYPVISEGTLIINGGTYKSGLDKDGYQNAVIYARGEGNITINGGIYQCDKANDSLPAERKDYRYTINKKDGDRKTTKIEVKGGKFYHFNPAQSLSENPQENFVAEGYKSYAVGANWFAVVKK